MTTISDPIRSKRNGFNPAETIKSLKPNAFAETRKKDDVPLFHHPSLFPTTVSRFGFLLLTLFGFGLNPAIAIFDINITRPASAQETTLRLERVVIDSNFPGAYQVEIADVNGDARPDIVAVGGNTCAWYENPSWKKRIVTDAKTSPGVISSATIDLNGDGSAEIAIAHDFEMNEPTRGKLILAKQGKTLDDSWTVVSITDLGSIHRIRWGDVNGDKRPDLVVAPIFGPNAKPPRFQEEPAHLAVFETGTEPLNGRWTKRSVGDLPVLHAIRVLDLDGDGSSEILGASNLGVTRFSILKTTEGFGAAILAKGAPGEAPKQGCSEIHVGRLSNGRRFLATVEPWHGSEVAVYLEDPGMSGRFGGRAVIDASLKEGHALWVADIDGDGDSEIFAGYRGPGTSVNGYKFDGRSWSKTVVDSAIAAQDLRGGDLDSDGKADFVAAGGSTHNIVWYRPVAK